MCAGGPSGITVGGYDQKPWEWCWYSCGDSGCGACKKKGGWWKYALAIVAVIASGGAALPAVLGAAGLGFSIGSSIDENNVGPTSVTGAMPDMTATSLSASTDGLRRNTIYTDRVGPMSACLTDTGGKLSGGDAKAYGCRGEYWQITSVPPP